MLAAEEGSSFPDMNEGAGMHRRAPAEAGQSCKGRAAVSEGPEGRKARRWLKRSFGPGRRQVTCCRAVARAHKDLG